MQKWSSKGRFIWWPEPDVVTVTRRFGPLPPWALTKITEAPFETQDRWLQTDPAGSTLEEFLR